MIQMLLDDSGRNIILQVPLLPHLKLYTVPIAGAPLAVLQANLGRYGRYLKEDTKVGKVPNRRFRIIIKPSKILSKVTVRILNPCCRWPILYF